jgi:hypothetical protein
MTSACQNGHDDAFDAMSELGAGANSTALVVAIRSSWFSCPAELPEAARRGTSSVRLPEPPCSPSGSDNTTGENSKCFRLSLRHAVVRPTSGIRAFGQSGVNFDLHDRTQFCLPRVSTRASSPWVRESVCLFLPMRPALFRPARGRCNRSIGRGRSDPAGRSVALLVPFPPGERKDCYPTAKARDPGPRNTVRDTTVTRRQLPKRPPRRERISLGPLERFSSCSRISIEMPRPTQIPNPSRFHS